jgi:hypothetical protein
VVKAAGAIAALALFAAALLQTYWATGGDWGLEAAWSGGHFELTTRLRVWSGVSAAVLIVAAAIVLARAGYEVSAVPRVVAHWGTWAVSALLLVSAFANFSSSSDWERFLNAPAALVTALLCAVVARDNRWPRLRIKRQPRPRAAGNSGGGGGRRRRGRR